MSLSESRVPGPGPGRNGTTPLAAPSAIELCRPYTPACWPRSSGESGWKPSPTAPTLRSYSPMTRDGHTRSPSAPDV